MSYDFSKLRVLIVDDSSHMRQLVRRILGSFGIDDIRDAPDGMSGLAELRQTMPDLVITDFAMEPMDGIDFTRLLRQADDSPNPYLPIVMMTGYTEKSRVIEARDCGVNELVAKPVSAMALYSRLVAVVERPRPFIRAADFFGPDRRRRQVPTKFPNRRKGANTDAAGGSFDIELG